MKIVEYSKGSITEVENVFKVVESGAQGPQGPAGTIGTLDLLDPKVTPVNADLMLVGDSADSFANKSTTWANIKATLKAYFDAIYQPLSTALSKITESGGLPLWDGAAWPGGGGGSEWTDIQVQEILADVAFVDFINKATDLYNTYMVDVYSLAPAAGSDPYPCLVFGYGVGPTWLGGTGYNSTVLYNSSNIDDAVANGWPNHDCLVISDKLYTNDYRYTGSILINNLRDTTEPTEVFAEGMTRKSPNIRNASTRGVESAGTEKIDHIRVTGDKVLNFGAGILVLKGKNSP